MKPKKKAQRRAAPEETATPSSRPEREDGDTEVVPPFAGTAEAEEERAEAVADDDGMPGEDAAGSDGVGVKRRARL